MTSIGSTMIDSLPVSGQSPQSAPAIQLETQDTVIAQQQPNNMAMAQPMNMDATHVNQLISGIQQASVAGLTTLPSRDIPMTSDHLTKDEQMKPNYIPDASAGDYISSPQFNPQQYIQNYQQTQQKQNSLEQWYDELQLPVLLAVLYFVFQLPVVRRQLLTFLPRLFHPDGHPNLLGYLVNSLAFGGIYYSLTKFKNYFAA